MSAGVIGLEVDAFGDGSTFGTVTDFNEGGVTVDVGGTIIASNRFSGLYARVLELVDGEARA